jgi:hypothetical protein
MADIAGLMRASIAQPLKGPFPQALQDQYGWKHEQQALRQQAIKTEVTAQPRSIPTSERQALPVEVLSGEIREELYSDRPCQLQGDA